MKSPLFLIRVYSRSFVVKKRTVPQMPLVKAQGERADKARGGEADDPPAREDAESHLRVNTSFQCVPSLFESAGWRER